MSNREVFDNEKWWQEHGNEWGDIVEDRRSTQPLYGIQEVVLSSYFSGLPDKSRVAEFGVGFGRHIEYLNQLPNVEVYGIDQSPTMLESLRNRLHEEKELINRMILIEPRQSLPFPDDYFDVVYTVSVLIHINPQHLPEILAELIRVSKHGIIHFENLYTDAPTMTAPDHNGCWGHPIAKVYKELGYEAKVLQRAAEEQDAYFVKLSKDERFDFTISPVIMQRLRILDERIHPHMKFLEGEVGWRTLELAERQKREAEYQTTEQSMRKTIEEQKAAINDQKALINDQKAVINDQKVVINDQKAVIEECKSSNQRLESSIQEYHAVLHEIQSSIAWKIVTKVRQNKLLYAFSKPLRVVLKKKRVQPQSEQHVTEDQETENFQLFRESMEKEEIDDFIAIYHPDWIGVSHSTKDLFKITAPLREVHSGTEAKHIAELMVNKGIRRVLFSGMAIGYRQVIIEMKKLDPSIKVQLFWHGNTTHMYEDYSWYRHEEILELCHKGLIDTWGFAKKSMAEYYKQLGISTAFVMNYFETKTDLPQPEKSNLLKIGLYASGTTWNKNAYTQIAAARLIGEDVILRAVPCNDRMREFAKQLDVKMDGVNAPLSREQLHKQMRENNLNLYVTFTECAPLIPLESLSLGVPCLTGPNHHYFTGTPLEEYLVVSSPDNTIEIAQKAVRAIKEKDTILRLYNEWVKEYNKLAKQSVVDFIG